MEDRRTTPMRRTKSTRPTGKGRSRRSRRRLPTVEEVSAGGLVLDPKSAQPRAVLISHFDRRGRVIWSLPKGHLEEGETPEEAGIREVWEETGIEAEIVAELGSVDFWFNAEDRRVHKTVHHYLMRATGGTIAGDPNEVLSAEWVELDRAAARLAYSDERRLLHKAKRMLAEAVSEAQ